MDCPEFAKFAEAYVDGEFAVSDTAEVEAHLTTCSPCRAAANQLEAFSIFLRAHLELGEAPPGLRQSIGRALRGRRGAHVRASLGTLLVLAAVLALVLLVPRVFPGLTERPFVLSTARAASPLIEAAVDWHRRELPVEVSGPQEGTVSAWFSGKLDFPVHPPTFAAPRGSSLVGGRLSSYNNRGVAVLSYDIEGSRVSVIALHPSQTLPGPTGFDAIHGRHFRLTGRDGFRVALVNGEGATYAITTDMPSQRFAQVVHTARFDSR